MEFLSLISFILSIEKIDIFLFNWNSLITFALFSKFNKSVKFVNI